MRTSRRAFTVDLRPVADGAIGGLALDLANFGDYLGRAREQDRHRYRELRPEALERNKATVPVDEPPVTMRWPASRWRRG